MKRVFSLLLAFALLLSYCSIVYTESSEPEKKNSGDFEYILIEDGTARITKYRGKASELVIPEKLDGITVTSIGDCAFISYLFSPLTSVTIPNNVTDIGDYAFSNCRNLIDVILPDSVTRIGNWAFSGCDSLSKIIIPDSVTSIGANPFEDCKNLKIMRISPDHPTLAVIDGVLFYKPDKLLVCCPMGLAKEVYSIPQGVKSIGIDAFYNNMNLISLTIPDSVTSIHANPFRYCGNLSSIIISPDHPTLTVIDGALISKLDSRLVWYPMKSSEKIYSVPEGTLTIENSAFESCKNLTDVNIPDSVTSIGDNAFVGCTNLISISLPNSITSIGNHVFSSCSNLTSITIPNDVTSIGDMSFCYCFRLASVKIPDSVTSIGISAFQYCESLISVTIPNNVTDIGHSAFSNCTNLASVVIPDSVMKIGFGAFTGCNYLTLTVPRNSYAAQYCNENGLNYTYPDSLDWLTN